MMQQVRNHISEAKAEAGQAIVFVALFMIVMIGMLGLAIDGGGLFFLWRDAQGAADSAVLSAAYAQCSGSETAQIKGRALETADRNGFNNDPDDDQDHEVRVIVGNNTDETDTVEDRSSGTMMTEQAFIQARLNDVAGSGGLSPSNFVWVDILAYKPSFFIQVVYDGPLSVNPSAMAHCNPGFDSSTIPGAFATDTCNNNLSWSGSNSYYYGDMHSNADIDINSSQGGAVFNNVIATAVGVVNGKDKIRNRVGGTAPNQAATDAGQTWWLDEGVPARELNFYTPEQIRNIYGPGGFMAEHIIAEYGANFYTSYSGDLTIKDTGSGSNVTLRGLHYVDGDVSITIDDEKTNPLTIYSDTTENSGATIVATGNINVSIKDDDHTFQWKYFAGMMDEIDERQYPGFIFVSLDEAGECNPGNAAIEVGGNVGPSNAAVKDYASVSIPIPAVFGVMYAPSHGVTAGGSTMTYRGAVLASFIKYNMSNGAFIHDPSLIPSVPRSVNNVQ